MRYFCALKILFISLVASTITIYGLIIAVNITRASYTFTNGEVSIIWILMAILVSNILKMQVLF